MPQHRQNSKVRSSGGRIKPSEILGGISAASTGASALGVTAPFLLPVAGLTGIASGIARLFGAGGLTKQQMMILQRAQRQGLVINKMPSNSRQRKGGAVQKRKPPIRRKRKAPVRRRKK